MLKWKITIILKQLEINLTGTSLQILYKDINGAFKTITKFIQ